jgi:hypothetical protein
MNHLTSGKQIFEEAGGALRRFHPPFFKKSYLSVETRLIAFVIYQRFFSQKFINATHDKMINHISGKPGPYR